MDKNIECVVSYSGGKDAVLAIYRALRLGYSPRYLFTTYNESINKSWFHGIGEELLNNVARSLNIPLKLIKTGFGQDYGEDFEAGLKYFKEKGLEACIFGDIDILEHYTWCDTRCRNVGMESIFPLWEESRLDLVNEFIDLGFKAIITIVDGSRLGKEFLGKSLTRQLVLEIEKTGADPCGENGEYHTFCYGGPIFKEDIDFKVGNKIKRGNYFILPIY